MRGLLVLALFAFFANIENSQAQFSAQRTAAYFATLKVVADYKLNDEEIARDIGTLRQNERFNQDLQKMLDKLSNTKSKDGRNKRVYDILERAGKDIYDLLK